MSTSNEPLQHQRDELQFDQAEFTAESSTAQPEIPQCSACKSPITDLYYESGGKVLCRLCRDELERLTQSGSRLTRAFNALISGSIAAAIGATLYYAIIRITGWNIGLVAVVVGLMVGGAVKSGSGNRGGLFYQILAVLLTYTAIAAMYVPLFREAQRVQLQKQAEKEKVFFEQLDQSLAKMEKETAGRKKGESADARSTQGAGEKEPGPAQVGQGQAIKADPGQEEQASDIKTDANLRADLLAASKEFSRQRRKQALERQNWLFYAGIPLFIGLASPLSGLIFLFAFWEAWKINRRVQLAFSGPFRLATPTAPAPEPEEADDES